MIAHEGRYIQKEIREDLNRKVQHKINFLENRENRILSTFII